MEKFNFFKIAKISCFVLGLFSLLFTSCKEEPENEKAPDDWNEKPVKQILADGFTAEYPIDFPLKAYPSKTPFRITSLGDDMHVDSFYTFITYDSTSVRPDSVYEVTIQYFKMTSPSSVEASEVDNIINVFKEYFYPEEIAKIEADEATTFAGYSAHKLCVISNKRYLEHYVFYVPNQKKVYIALIAIPESQVANRRDELFKIASTFKLK